MWHAGGRAWTLALCCTIGLVLIALPARAGLPLLYPIP